MLVSYFWKDELGISFFASSLSLMDLWISIFRVALGLSSLKRPAHHIPICSGNLLRMSSETLYSTPVLDTIHLDGWCSHFLACVSFQSGIAFGCNVVAHRTVDITKTIEEKRCVSDSFCLSCSRFLCDFIYNTLVRYFYNWLLSYVWSASHLLA